MNHPLPNIVVITADQWRGDCIGYRSRRHPVMSPHVNQLAAEGIDFTNAYADCPICMPQRATLLSGLTGATFGETFNFGCRTPVSPERSLPHLLSSERNYQTKAIGKMHFSPARARLGFDDINLHPDDYVNWLEDVGYGGLFRGHGLGGNEVYPAVSAVPERFSHTNWIVEQSCRFLSQRDPESPFFLWMVFEAPHSPFDPPAPYDRFYDNFSIPEPLHADWQDTHMPQELSDKIESFKFENLTPEMIAEARRKYYGQITHIDYQLGRFLGELKSKGLYENTTIVFTADHGEHLGDFGLFGKTTYLTGSGDVPLIVKPAISQKDGLRRGMTCTHPVLTADIYTSILNCAGVAHDPGDGLDLFETSKSVGSDRVICGECSTGDFRTAFAANAQYKYIYFAVNGREMLFDMEKDPDNLHDLSGESASTAEKNVLKDELFRFLSERNRKGLVHDEAFVRLPGNSHPERLRPQNPFAWRGPMHFGGGY